MPELDGLEATRRLSDGDGATRVLMLTTFDLDEYVYEAMKAGASGFLLKDVRPEQLAEAVRVVAAGEALLAPAITRRLIEEFVRRPAPGSGAPAELAELTERELEVVEARRPRALERRDRRRRSSSSEATVKTHVTHILGEAPAPRSRAGGRARLRVGPRPARRRVAPRSQGHDSSTRQKPRLSLGPGEALNDVGRIRAPARRSAGPAGRTLFA